MPDYSKGVIYMLEPTIEYDKGDIYYGSTTQPLYKRLFQHKSSFNCDRPCRPCKSILLFQKYGLESVKIILIKKFPCDDKKKLEAEEATYIRNNKCVNGLIPNRSLQEWHEDNKPTIKEYQKEWHEKNKPKIKEQQKEYREANNTKITELNKRYRELNKEKIQEYQKEYYETHKDKIKCDCGCLVMKHKLKRHQQTKKHNVLMKNKI
jgi:hypothetical protein